MARDKIRVDIDSEQIRQEAAQLAGALAAQAEQAVDRVADWAGASLSRAREEAEKVARQAQVKAGPALEEARARTEEALAEARAKVVDDYAPRVQRATSAARSAAAASEGVPLTERAQIISVAVKEAALEEVPVKKKHPVLKTLGWVAVAACAAGAAYVIWQRSQPVEDPWAEEYWADSEEEDAADAVAEAAGTVTEKVEEAVEGAADAAEEVAEKISEKVSKAVKDAEGK